MIDRADGRAVFTALLQRVDAALDQATSGRFRCRRAVPRIDGSLYFDLARGERLFRLDWLGPDRELELSENQSTGKDSQLVVETVNNALAEALAQDDFFLLRFYNQEISSLRFDDDVVDMLLAGRLEPGRTSWFAYRFMDVFQETSEAFYITFHGPRGPVVFWVCSAAAPGLSRGEKLYSNRHFLLGLYDDRRDPESRQLMSHQVERFLGFILNRAVHDRMTLVVSAPAVAGVSSSSPDSISREIDSGPVSTSRWGNPRQWYQFFSDFEIERGNLCAFNFSDPASWITHGENECRNIEPHMFTKTVFYANMPWSPQPRAGDSGSTGYFTALGEDDVVKGGTAKLEAALLSAVSNPDACMVCVNDTCLPKIIGDDVRSTIARIQKSSSLPIFHLNTDLGSPNSAFLNLVEQARRKVEVARELDGREGLNLIGFRPGRDRDEIIDELKDAGVPVNVCLIPEFGVEPLAKYLHGKAGVVYPHSLFLELAEKTLADLNVPRMVLPAPYGLRRTREWFQAVTETLSLPGAFEAWESRRRETAEDQWSAMTAEAREHGLAVVVQKESLSRLVDPSWHYGFELLPLLEEMGFSLHILVKQPSGEKSLDVQTLTRALAEPERHTFTGFCTPEELSGLLREGTFNAVYSEVFFDTRISRAGKAQFELSMIEMGVRGALRSLERLLHVCRWPFYQRYHRYLAAEGE